LTAPAGFGPYQFTLTDDEARLAAARLALRHGLAARFEREYVAPLVVFILLLVFVAILAFSGLISRRLGEAALLLGAIIFLTTRFLAHWRLRRAQRLATSAVARIAAGETCLTIDDAGLTIRNGSDGEARRDSFIELSEAEDAGGVIYLWRPTQERAPIIIPTRIFGDAAEADKLLAFARARIRTS
jgi:hypothetical protein